MRASVPVARGAGGRQAEETASLPIETPFLQLLLASLFVCFTVLLLCASTFKTKRQSSIRVCLNSTCVFLIGSSSGLPFKAVASLSLQVTDVRPKIDRPSFVGCIASLSCSSSSRLLRLTGPTSPTLLQQRGASASFHPHTSSRLRSTQSCDRSQLGGVRTIAGGTGGQQGRSKPGNTQQHIRERERDSDISQADGRVRGAAKKAKDPKINYHVPIGRVRGGLGHVGGHVQREHPLPPRDTQD